MIMLLMLSLIMNCYFIINSQNTNKNNYENNYNNFKEIVQSIINDYNYDDYVEYLGSYSHLLLTPINKSDKEFINRQKLFIYNSNSRNTIIIASVTASKFNDIINDEWQHSFDCTPKLLEKYGVISPLNTSVASNSFNINGCNITLLALCEYSEDNTSLAAQELINFSNSLIKFLEKVTGEEK